MMYNLLSTTGQLLHLLQKSHTRHYYSQQIATIEYIIVTHNHITC